MVYWCSTDVTNKDYPCAAVRVCVLPFPVSASEYQPVLSAVLKSGVEVALGCQRGSTKGFGG